MIDSTNSKGFTLVELMIAMFIMAVLTTIVSSAIRTSVQNKKKLEHRITAQATVYDTIRIIKRDVEKAFHYQDFFYEIEKKAIDQLNESIKKVKPGQNQPARQPYPVPRPPQKLTHFVGLSDAVHFTSLNHFRTRYNAQESDQMEVGYFVDTCETRKTRNATKCLYRRTSPYLDDAVDEGGRKMVVAEHVTKFNLQYRSDQENAEWVDQWRSDNKGRQDHRNRFPHQVKLELEIHDEDSKYASRMKESLIMNIHFPNNEPLFKPEPNARQNNNRRPRTR